jgi:signal transduction histidine kinase
VRRKKLWYIGNDIGILSCLESMPDESGFTYAHFDDPEGAIGRMSESQPDAILFGLEIERAIEFLNDGIARSALQKCGTVTVYLARQPESESAAALDAGYDLVWDTLPPDMNIFCAAIKREIAKKKGEYNPDCDIAICKGLYNETVAALAEGAVDLLKLKEDLETQNTELRLVRDELEQFVHTISHDLKEPLMAVRTFSRLLAEELTNLNGEQTGHLRLITESVELMARQIDSLLKFSRAGRISPDAKVECLKDIIDEILHERGIDRSSNITVHLKGLLPAIAAAPQQVHQIFSNLISNGIKHNRNEHREIEIAVEDEVPSELPSMFIDGVIPSGFALFSITDNGTGIPGEDREVPFELFQRLANANGTEGDGAGLAIVKRAVTSLSGAIDYVTKMDEGTTMYFTLPVISSGRCVVPLKSKSESRSVSVLKAALLS